MGSSSTYILDLKIVFDDRKKKNRRIMKGNMNRKVKKKLKITITTITIVINKIGRKK